MTHSIDAAAFDAAELSGVQLAPRRVPDAANLSATAARGAPRLARDRGEGARVWIVALILLVVMFPFLWLVQLAFKPAAELFDDALLFTPSFHVPPFGLHRRFDRHRLNGTEKLSGDRGVDTETTERETPGPPEHLVGTLTTINGLSRRPARVAHH